MAAGNPWLTIPLADYEAHMALPQVGQAQLLAPERLAVLAERHGYRALGSDFATASGGKRFAVQSFERI